MNAPMSIRALCVESNRHEWYQSTHKRGTIARMTTPQTVGAVVGEALYRLRVARGQTQDDAARHLRSRGLSWTRDHIASLETRRNPRSVTVEELFLLSAAYAVPLASWFEGDGEVIVTGDVSVPRSVLSAALSTKRAPSAKDALIVDFADVPDVDRTEQTVAHKLGVEAPDVQHAAQRLWGRTFSQERDRRVGEGVSPGRARTLRAGMTKRMIREIEPQLREQSS